ncbi:hypothetical protein CDD83_3660 [Cordyceps sp. RAO-2017]|nr:hypothetical protein CDD83_3660 [Cordyceps sp. RAO-2017]
MVFVAPSWAPALPDLPDSVTIEEFINSESHGRFPLAESRDPYTCGLTGLTRSAADVVRRVDLVARALGKRLGFNPNEGTAWERVVAIYSVNAVDFLPVALAVHRLSGIVTPANAAYSVAELEHQLRSSEAKAIFTCASLLDNALAVARTLGIPEDRVFLLPTPGAAAHSGRAASVPTVDDLAAEGRGLAPVERPRWIRGQAARQPAFLSYSSGTSGLPKAVIISHRNVIANIVQLCLPEVGTRRQLGIRTQTSLGVLPFTHIYGLVMVSLVAHYRGDQIVVLPKFDLAAVLAAVQRFRIEELKVVPPILIQISRRPELCAKYDLSSIRWLFSGAAPLGSEVIDDLLKQYPKWKIGQGYGMTETSPGVSMSIETDCLLGSSGSLIPGTVAKLIDTEGNEVTEHGKPGELLIQSPSVVLGYLNNEKANAETFIWDKDGRWLRTGDEAVIRRSSQGSEHLFITDRIKELIKVKGHQVAPAELEAHLLAHPFVSDCTVIPVPDDRAGEVPKAFVVKTKAAAPRSDADIATALCKHVEDHKARYKWLNGGVEFIDAVPKSPSGKILRRLLKDKERQARKKRAAKL